MKFFSNLACAKSMVRVSKGLSYGDLIVHFTDMNYVVCLVEYCSQN